MRRQRQLLDAKATLLTTPKRRKRRKLLNEITMASLHFAMAGFECRPLRSSQGASAKFVEQRAQTSLGPRTTSRLANLTTTNQITRGRVA